MGAHPNINYDKFPKQGSWLSQHVNVCFNYDTSKIWNGIIVRDDREEPFLTIIKLDNGNYIMSTECQFQPK